MDEWLIAAAAVVSCWKLETQATDKRRIQCSVNRKKKAPTTTTKEKQETTVNWWKENLMLDNSFIKTGGEC